MIHLAIVGIGGYGGALLRVLQAVQEELDCKLVAAADLRMGELGEKARELESSGVALYDDPAAMLADLHGTCQAVYVATGIATHAPLTTAAAEAGCHVHLEKPPAATVQDVDAMLAALARADRFCLVGFQALHGHLRLLLDRLAEGQLGKVRDIHCRAGWPRKRAYYRRNDWAGRLRCDDGWVLDGPATNALAHQLAHMLALASPRPGKFATPVAVRAELYAAGHVESHNLAAIEVRTAEGPVLRFYCSHATAGSFGPVIHVAAERGSATYNHGKSSALLFTDGTGQTRLDQGDDQHEMVANFLEAVRSGDPADLRCPLAETRKYVLALNAAHESSRTVHRIDEQYWHLEDAGTDDERVVVAGLDVLLAAAEDEGCLLSDLASPPPWAVPAEPFDLDNYTHFPQRFAP